MKNTPKQIGTVSLTENNNFSTSIPWECVTKNNLPYSILSLPDGFMFACGSACLSLATTSIQGYTYVQNTHVFRKDGTGVDVDRYLGSITPTDTIAVLKLPNDQIPFHHLKLTDSIISNLPLDKRKQICNILGMQQNP